MKIRFTLAAVAAAAGLASAQQVQVFQKIRPPVYETPAEPAKTDKPTEFKPAANTDPDPKSLDVPADLQKKGQELAAKLGSRVYAEREQATKELGKMGRMALPALYDAIGSATEPEVAQRAEGLLPKAEAEDMKARVACFLADTDGKYTHNLPGWEKFKKVAGDDKSSRELFGEALKQPLTHGMLLAADKTAEEANAVLNQYVGKLMGGQFRGDGTMYTPKPAEFLVALFLEGQFTDKEVVIQPANMQQWGFGGGAWFSVMGSNWGGVNLPSEVQSAIYSNTGKNKDTIRRLVLQWMDTRETTMAANQAYNYAQSMFNRQEDTKKRFKYAAKVLEAESGPNTSYMKLTILTQFGQAANGAGKDFLPSIAKCFDDSTLIWNWQSQNPPFDIQLRDYALAVALQMTDQKPEDYEMSRTPGYGSAKDKRWEQQAFYFKDDTPNKNPNFGGGGRFPRKGGGIPVDPKDDKDKKDDTKKDDPKEKKVSQDDRRKIAFKKWDEWVKENVGIDEKDKADERTKKWEAWAKAPKKEPKKDDTKDETKPGGKDEPKKEPTAEEQKKLEELKKEQKKEEVIRKEAETTVAPAVLPKK